MPPQHLQRHKDSKEKFRTLVVGFKIFLLNHKNQIQFPVGYEAPPPDLYCAALSGAVVDEYGAMVE
jgi:hypothetical protein